MEAAITAPLSQLLRWAELLLLWWESSRAQPKAFNLGSGQRAVSESIPLQTPCIKPQAACPRELHLLCSSTSWGAWSALGQRTLPSLPCQSCTHGQPWDTQGPSLPPAALLVALNTSKSDKKGRARAQNRTGGIKADGPDKGAIWIGIRGQSKVKKHKMEFFRFDKCGGNWLLLSQCLADAWIIYHSILCD